VASKRQSKSLAVDPKKAETCFLLHFQFVINTVADQKQAIDKKKKKKS